MDDNTIKIVNNDYEEINKVIRKPFVEKEKDNEFIKICEKLYDYTSF